HPLHPYTELLLASIPDPEASSPRPAAQTEPPSPLSPPSGCRFRTNCPKAVSRCAAEVPLMREIRPGHFAACHFSEAV
ncbi:MAG TPA: oligopeptide/dipeptide ABC transporter ATP-binding protein, partial [Stellaceae bacterium]|nr:oligopeptide/dipeptide ABC transporter ATP-binding protein [Stellaceae bacterium]